MHELALLQAVVDLLRKQAADHHIISVQKVKLVIGKMTMVMPDALEMAFSLYRQDPLFSQDAQLDIEERAVRAVCRNCRTEFTTEDIFGISCPDCGAFEVNLVAGDELFVDSFEGE